MLRVRVDFNTMNMDEERRVSLPTHVDPHLATFLRPGLRIVAFTPFDIEVEAVVELDAPSGEWLGRPDWSTLRSLQSDAQTRFWEVQGRLLEVREIRDSATEEALLKQEAQDLWNTLTQEEREYLRDIPQCAEYEAAWRRAHNDGL